ncbi:MAG TPA: hypothetical protein VFV34_26410 [Blastocatellia bacterium]|nr:hypothetical protein [Blastocatellia bacterium]
MGRDMTEVLSRKGEIPRPAMSMLQAAVLIGVALAGSAVCFGQSQNPSETGSVAAAESVAGQKPLTTDERAELLKLIRTLQERVEKLEAAQATSRATAQPTAQPTPAQHPSRLEGKPDPATQDDPHVWMAPVVKATPVSEAAETESYGRYTPNLGFKLANTEYGDLSLSVYTYARYLNQRGLNSTYSDAFGNTKNIQERQDFQLQKVQIKVLGWVLDPKFRYFLYTWTSNPTQGQGAQVVVAGNMGYTFNKYITLAGGITSLPGVRSTEGNFPFWLGVDSRMIGDEFFRPSYTSGFWVKGNVTKRLRYQAMIGNNLSTLGVSAARLDNKFNTFSTSFVWTPTGEFGQGFGDFEHHETFASRLAVHFTRSDENKESQPNNDTFENTQLRLSDGTVIFTPDLFGPGITITDARYRMVDVDWGLKYHGFAVEGEYYWRWLDNFKGTNTAGLPRLFDHGFQFQVSAMPITKVLQLYSGVSRINGQFGDPFDVRAGANWFPWANRVVRWNTEWLYLRNSPVGYSSVPFTVGGRGSVFHSSVELAF